jgi:DNA-binding PadR family transcriptional regulator
MASLTTRVLLLGVVSFFGPANGYQLRRELLSWGVEEWAHINPGSIYSMLTTLARAGLVKRTELIDGGRPVAVYTVSDDGNRELYRLLEDAFTSVQIREPALFSAALSFLPMVDREEFVGWLALQRSDIGRRMATLAEQSAEIREHNTAPLHVAYDLELRTGYLSTLKEWNERITADIRAGLLNFRDDQSGWQPPPDDSGWVMVEESARYRALMEQL